MPTRVTSLLVLALFLCAGAAPGQISTVEPGNPQALSAPAHSQVVRYEGRTERVRVPMVMEPWSATAVSTPPPQRKIVRFVGRFPGFAASKRQADLRTRAAAAARVPARKAGPLDPTSPSGTSVIFEGPNESDTSFVPPNPNIAAGPDYLVVVINSLMAIYDKSGNLQGGYNDLPTFFSSLGVTVDVYDPRVIYDQNDNRFIMSFTNVDLTNPTFGNVLIAVSQTSDPTGNWYKFMLDSKGFNSADHAATFPDFPTLGLSTSAVYISNGQFELNASCLYYGGCNFSDTWIRVIGLTELLAGDSNLNITTFNDVKTATGFPAFAVESALTYGASAEEFLVGAEFSANPGTTLNVFGINTTGTPTLTTANLPVPEFGIPAEAPQPGGSIETGDFRPLNAVASNGTLWCAQNSADNSGMGAVGRWYAISIPSLAGLALSQTGTISGAASAYFPAVAVEPNGDAIVSFTTSSNTEYASAAITGRSSSDAAGTMRGYSIYRQGTGTYIDFAFRWGDYNGAALDPSGNSVWTIVEYAGSPNPHFGTAIAQVSQPPPFTASALGLNFGNQVIAITSSPQSLTITNVSGTSVTVGTANLGGANPSDFALSGDNCSGSTMPAGGSCTVSITFTPSTTGQLTALLSLNSTPSTFPLTVLLYGNGVTPSGVLVLSPTSLQFPNTPVRGTSPSQPIQLTNIGNVPFPIAYILADSPFAESNNCGASLAAGASCTISLTFRPPSASSFTEWLEIVGVAQNDYTASVSAMLTGTGITAPAANLCPTLVSFGNQIVGTPSSPITVSLNNTGTGSLTVSQISINGDYAQTNTCGASGASLPAFTACTINVTFTPTAMGARNGTLTIADNSAGSPHTVSLAGTGVAGSSSLLPWPAALANLPLGLSGPPAMSRGVNPAVVRESGARAYGRLPLSFEANRGQFGPQVKFLSRGPGYSLFLTADEAVLALKGPGAGSQKAEERPLPLVPGHSRAVRNRRIDTRNQEQVTKHAVLRMRLVGASTRAAVTGADELPGQSNYFRGSDPRAWRTHIPNYARVRYESIYPGIDLVYYGHGRELEYDFVVTPGADPRDIRLEFKGRDGKSTPVGLRLDGNGDLLLVAGDSEIRLHRPMAYQPAGEVGPSAHVHRGLETQDRRVLESHYVLTANNEVHFDLGPYDHTRPLVIDPALTYSTYLGGSGDDYALGIAVDPAGEAYVVGWTDSADFPVANPLQPALNENLPYTSDAFVTKLSADGSSFLFSTFLGGSGSDAARAIALDNSGNAFVTGDTTSTDFPITTGAFQSSVRSENTAYPDHGFVTKISADGSTLMYSTYLGGSVQELPKAIAVDAAGNAYVTGTTTSPDFPTTSGAFQRTYTAIATSCGNQAFCGSGFVMALNSQGSALLYSTLLSGTKNDVPQAIAVDAGGNAYVAGISDSLNFPTTPGALQTGPAAEPEGFATKFTPQGQMIYSTYLAAITPSAIAIDSQGAAYLAGQGTPGSNPTLNSVQFGPPPYFMNSPGAVAKLHPAGCALQYSSFLGGVIGAYGTGIAVDTSGAAFVAGGTNSPDFPTVNPLRASCPACSFPGQTASPFVSKIDPTGSTLVYSTFVGGSSNPRFACCNQANALAIDSAGNAYIAGQTLSSDFPTANAIQPSFGGQVDGFVAKISPVVVPTLAISPAGVSFATQEVGTASPPQTITLTNQEAGSISISGITSSDSLNPQFSFTNNCGTSLGPGLSCTITVAFAPTESGALSAILTINDNAFAGPHVVSLAGTAISGPQVSISGLTGGTGVTTIGNALVGQTVGPSPVTVGNNGQSPLIITSVLTTGDFSQSNNCATLAYTASCTINISFTPTAPGNRTGTLTITDNAPDSPQVVTLLGGGEDFGFASSPSSMSVTAGKSATYSVTLTPIGGFDHQISITCTGVPQLATCSISSTSVTLDGSYAPTLSVTVTTTAPSSAPPVHGLPMVPWTRLLLTTLFCALIVFGGIAASARRWKMLSALAVTLVLVALWAGCGGGGGGVGGGNTGTPPGTYTLTVTGTSGSLTHTLSLTLTVN